MAENKVRKSSLKGNVSKEREPLLGSPISQPPSKQPRQEDLSGDVSEGDGEVSKKSEMDVSPGPSVSFAAGSKDRDQVHLAGFVQGESLVTGADWKNVIVQNGPPGIPVFPTADSQDSSRELP